MLAAPASCPLASPDDDPRGLQEPNASYWLAIEKGLSADSPVCDAHSGAQLIGSWDAAAKGE